MVKVMYEKKWRYYCVHTIVQPAAACLHDTRVCGTSESNNTAGNIIKYFKSTLVDTTRGSN